MKRSYPIALLVTLAVSSAALAESTITLKEEAYVKGPKVYLGDVAKITGDDATELANIELTGAAVPGTGKRVHAALLRTRLVDAGIDPGKVTLEGARSVMAKTLSLEVTRGAIEQSLREHIQGEMPWEMNDVTIDLMVSSSGFTVPEGELMFLWRANPQYRWVGLGGFRGEVLVDGEHQRALVCRAKIEAYVEVLVAKKDLLRGKIITSSDVELEKRALSLMKSSPITDPDEVVGNLARSTIHAGQVITSRYLQPRKLVRRGKLVPVEMRAGTLLVKGHALAKMDGHAGDMITLLNPSSKREFMGVVRADGVVVVE